MNMIRFDYNLPSHSIRLVFRPPRKQRSKTIRRRTREKAAGASELQKDPADYERQKNEKQ
jgi:hypothetical protein